MPACKPKVWWIAKRVFNPRREQSIVVKRDNISKINNHANTFIYKMQANSLPISLVNLNHFEEVKVVSYGKPENPVTFICVWTIHKGVTQIKQMKYIQRIITELYLYCGKHWVSFYLLSTNTTNGCQLNKGSYSLNLNLVLNIAPGNYLNLLVTIIWMPIHNCM